MPVSGDVTQWIRQLQGGDRDAVQKLWENYFSSLVGLARRKLGAVPRRFAAEVADEFERLLARLPDDELRQIALRKLEGYSKEIAGQVDLAPATVERRLRLPDPQALGRRGGALNGDS
jgi:DNA-directed RNA polymerase specialized sigma24 family protein